METITTIVVREQQIKLSLTLRLIMQMEKGRLRVVNRLGEINQFVRFATDVTEDNVGLTNRSALSVDSWET